MIANPEPNIDLTDPIYIVYRIKSLALCVTNLSYRSSYHKIVAFKLAVYESEQVSTSFVFTNTNVNNNKSVAFNVFSVFIIFISIVHRTFILLTPLRIVNLNQPHTQTSI